MKFGGQLPDGRYTTSNSVYKQGWRRASAVVCDFLSDGGPKWVRVGYDPGVIVTRSTGGGIQTVDVCGVMLRAILRHAARKEGA